MKTAMVSLTAVLGLLVMAVNAAPIIVKRDDNAASCPGTLRGPSGNAYFAFSTNLSIQTAREACASCYGGSLANVGAADLNFLGNNLESTSWIKAWNGDDYSSGCLTIQPSAGAQPGVGIDATCASQMWPLCTASAEQVEGLQRIDEEQQHTGEETIVTLAVPYEQKDAAPAPETIAGKDAVLEPTKADAEVSAAAPNVTGPEGPTVTCPKKPDGTSQTDGTCIEATKEAAAVVIVAEEPTKVVEDATAQEVVPDATAPASSCVTYPSHGVVAAEVILEEPTNIVADVINAVEEPTKVVDETKAKEPTPDATTPAVPCVTCPGLEATAAAIVLEEPTKVAAENSAVIPDATGPVSPDVTCPRSAVQTDNNCIVPEEAAAVVQEEGAAPVAEPVAPAAESVAPVAEPVAPAAEPVAPAAEPVNPAAESAAPAAEPVTPAAESAAPVAEPVAPAAESAAPVAEPVAPAAESVAPAAESVAPAAESVAPAAEPVAPTTTESPAPAAAEFCVATLAATVETIDALTIEKEKVQAAFEADTGSCSSQLALGEQDPLVNEYMIETLSETASCSEARQEAIAADVQARVAHYEAAQAALQVPPSSA